MRALVLVVASAWATISGAAVLGAASGSGPLPAVAELRESLPTHTLYRPQQLPKRRLPLLIWGNGGCRNDGLRYASFLREIASHGYVVIAVGPPGKEQPYNPVPPPASTAPPGQPQPRNLPDESQASQLVDAIDWANKEDARVGSDLAGHLDLSRIAVAGHSCGGLQSLAVAADPRIDTTLILASGVIVRKGPEHRGIQVEKSQLDKLHGPVLYLSGGPTDIAYVNAVDDVARINHVPVFFGALPVGHGGTFFTERNGGQWARVATRWLDWHLKADADASWDFAGPECRLCRNKAWTVVQKQLPLPSGPYRESLYVPVRDGTKLAMHVYRAARDGVPIAAPQPVVFSFTPYRARFYNAAGERQELDQYTRSRLDEALLGNGYALAVADIRGKGASFGARRGFQDRTEAEDGRDLVQWLAAQPWSNGRVGMFGCSYLGGTTLHVATTVPPALRAIFSGASDIDKFSFVRNGGITAQFNTRPDEPLSDDLASVPIDGDIGGEQLQAAVAQHANNTPMAPLWYGMPFRDSVSPLTGNAFWKEVGPYPYLENIRRSGMATYFWSNWEDEPTSQVILTAENLGGRLIIGPGSHCVPPPGIDFPNLVRRYFDQHLKEGAANVEPAAPRVTWWLDGVDPAAAWQRSDSVPGLDAPRTTLHLVAGKGTDAPGLLQPRAPARGERAFTVNYDVGPPEAFAFWVASQHGRGLSFETAALPRATRLTGYPLLQLRVAADRAEPLLFAYLETVPAQGAAKVIAFGRLAAAYRKQGAAPYNMRGLPFHTGESADHAPLQPGKFVDLRFALTPTARVIPAGEKLRLVITGADPRQRNLQQIKVTPAPNIRVQLGAASRLELVMESEGS